jgi:hypothetical protein
LRWAGEKGAEGTGEALGFVADLGPGAVDDGPAGDSKALISKAVLLEGGDGSVDATTVSFDDEPGIAPHEVGHHRDAVNNHVAIHLGRRKFASPEEREKSFLELSSSILFARVVVRDGEPKTSDPTPPPASPQQLVECL